MQVELNGKRVFIIAVGAGMGHPWLLAVIVTRNQSGRAFTSG